ncbi:hypothetical protein K1719_000825 [Acacia pycnantha]|nr:hypothetical protein K1719_000825 [Acacia pycnantha]
MSSNAIGSNLGQLTGNYVVQCSCIHRVKDLVIHVTAESYRSWNLEDPILYTNDGNSLFNITSNGVFYFTSAEAGH